MSRQSANDAVAAVSALRSAYEDQRRYNNSLIAEVATSRTTIEDLKEALEESEREKANLHQKIRYLQIQAKRVHPVGRDTPPREET